MSTLDREVKYLINKAKNWRPPKKPKDDKKGAIFNVARKII